jgi:hypothetical protein
MFAAGEKLVLKTEKLSRPGIFHFSKRGSVSA